MDIHGRKIVLYSDWFEAERFYYQYQELKLEYCIFDQEEFAMDTFHGVPVLSFDLLRIKRENELIVIHEKNYSEIKNQFLEIGLLEFENFIPSQLINKKMVIIHGNCYVVPLIKYLMKIREFTRQYYIYPIPLVCCNLEHEISEKLLYKCDIFIHQNINTLGYGKKLTDEWIVPRLPDSCKEIVIPNFMGIYHGGVFFFPQCIGEKKRKKLIIKGNNFFSYTDYYIEKCSNEGVDCKEIARRIQEDDVFERVFIEHVFQNSMQDLLKREKKWDVKISDYFLNTYNEKQFFLDAGHPTEHVIKEIAIRLVKKLGIFFDPKRLKGLEEESLNLNEIPTYQCVKRVLHLNWQSHELRKNTNYKLTLEEMDIDEYVKEYVYFSEYAESSINKWNEKLLSEWQKEGRMVFFGAGNWFKDYMEHYGDKYIPSLIVDNDIQKQGQEIYGIRIGCPQEITSRDSVIICSAAYNDIEQQLLEMRSGMKYAFYKPDGFIERT